MGRGASAALTVWQAAELGFARTAGLAPSTAESIHSTIRPLWTRKKVPILVRVPTILPFWTRSRTAREPG